MGRQGTLLRCMACDADFHRKCSDMDTRGAAAAAEVVLCSSCWAGQR
jgi:hypothetical protein